MSVRVTPPLLAVLLRTDPTLPVRVARSAHHLLAGAAGLGVYTLMWPARSMNSTAWMLTVLAATLTLLGISDRLAMQILLSLAGILVMIVVATLLNSISIRHEQQPRWTHPTEQVHKQVGLPGE